MDNLGCLERNGVLVWGNEASADKDIIMIKDILQKNHIGLGLGLMVLLVNQGFARPPAPTSIQHLAFSNDFSQILYISNRSAATTSLVNVVDAKTGVAAASTQLSVKQRILGFTPDGFKTAVLEPKGLSILHNKTGKVLRTLKVPSLPWPNQYGAEVAITNKSGTAQLFHTANKRMLNVVHTGNGRVLVGITLPAGALRSMGISQDGRTVAYAQEKSAVETQLHLYDTYQKKVTKRISLPRLAGPTSRIGAVSFSPKGKHLLVGTTLIDLADESVSNVVPSKGSVPAVFTPNGRYLLVASGGSQLVRYDLRSKQKQGINLGFTNRCTVSQAVDISPNGKFIAYGSRCPRVTGGASFISILNAADGSFVKKLSVTL